MENQLDFIEPLFEKAENYGKTNFLLFKLKALNKASTLIASFISHSMTVLFFLIFLIFINIGAAFWLGDLLGKTYYGFFCIALFYLLVSSVTYFFIHNIIKKQIINSIINQLLN